MTLPTTPTQPDQGSQPTHQQQQPEAGPGPIPYARFAEVNAEKRKLEEQLSQLKAAQQAEVEKQLLSQQQYKELAEKRGQDLAEANAKAAKVDAYEQTLTAVLASQVSTLPEEARELIPEHYTVAQKLEWLAKNAPRLRAPAAIDIGAGRQGGTGQRKIDLTPDEIQMAARFGMSPEEYAKNKV